MSCIICHKFSKPWMLLKNDNIICDDNNKPTTETIQTCGYSCCRKLNPMLPPNYGNLILNREDFCFWAVPVLPKKKNFVFLTYDEIQKLDEIKKKEYYTKKANYLMDDYMKAELYNELEYEDKITYNIENDEYSDSDFGYEDDY